MVIKQHIPSFMDCGDNYEAEFDSLEELLAISWVRDWSLAEEFYRYSFCEKNDSRSFLMAEFNEGKRWWVVGYMDIAQLPGLPIFKTD